MTVVYVSDFDLRGSGYANIAVSLCLELVKANYDVIAIGLGYTGTEHAYPFKIIPAQLQDIVPMIHQLRAANVKIEALVVALDIPLQERILQQLMRTLPGIPYVGLFPLEAGPLCSPWAMTLLQMDRRLIMSKFGQAELKVVGVDSDFIPIGVDTESWRAPAPDERARLRQGLGVEDGQIVVLTVADNQERKNLSRSMEIFSDFSRQYNAIYWLVTRPHSPVGWKLEDYATRPDVDIMNRLMIWERGIPFNQLWALYASADIFLLTSKAEGLAMPILEAMSCGLPVVGTKCAAIEEHLSAERGLLIEPDYIMCDPWGNSNRYLASRADGLYKMQLWQTGMTPGDRTAMLMRAREYTQARTWDGAGEVLIKAIEGAKDDKK